VAQRAAAKLKEAALPRRMEMWEIAKKLKQASGTKDADPTSSFSFRPSINHTVPDFDKHRQEWDATLQVGWLSHTPPSINHPHHHPSYFPSRTRTQHLAMCV
jgi:hypothetical protein